MDQTFQKRPVSTPSHIVADMRSDEHEIGGKVISSTSKRLRILVDAETAKIMCAQERQVIDHLVSDGDKYFDGFDGSTVADMWTSACSFTAADGLVMNLVPDPETSNVIWEDVPSQKFFVQVTGLSIRPNIIRTLWTVKRAPEAADALAVAAEQVRELQVAGDTGRTMEWLVQHRFTPGAE